jgi:hypothetical protein
MKKIKRRFIVWAILWFNRMLGKHAQNGFISKRDVAEAICEVQYDFRDCLKIVRILGELRERLEAKSL